MKDERGVRGILIKESVELDYCRCGSYCGDYSQEVIEEVSGKTVEELVAAAAALIPICTDHSNGDALARLYLVTDDLSGRVQAVFDARVAAKRQEEERRRSAAEQEARLRRDRAEVERLQAQLEALESGDEAARVRAELVEAVARCKEAEPASVAVDQDRRSFT